MLEREQSTKRVGIILSGLVENLKTHILTRKICAFLADDTAISSVEYGLLLALIGGALILGAESLSSAVADQFYDTASCLDGSADANGGQGDGTGGGGGSGSGSGQGNGKGDGFAIC